MQIEDDIQIKIPVCQLYRYYDLYRNLRLQFLVLLMMGTVTLETCRVTLQWNKSDCILLHLVGLLFNVNYDARNHELKNWTKLTVLGYLAAFFTSWGTSCCLHRAKQHRHTDKFPSKLPPPTRPGKLWSLSHSMMQPVWYYLTRKSKPVKIDQKKKKDRNRNFVSLFHYRPITIKSTVYIWTELRIKIFMCRPVISFSLAMFTTICSEGLYAWLMHFVVCDVRIYQMMRDSV